MSDNLYEDIDGEELREELEEFPELRKIWENAEGDLEDFFKVCDRAIWQNAMLGEALSAENMRNGNIAEFSRLIDQDFAELCRIDPTSTDVESARELGRILQSMESIAAFPGLYTKSIGAVGGGFSSGKSAFINSFLTSRKLRLAEGIRPVTAIPSYVLHDSENASITGINYRHGRFSISPELYKRLSHTELKKINFNLKYLINYIAVQAPLQPEYFSSMCLLDTPGYNPPESGSEKEDRITAISWLEKADFLIWVIGLDNNGTITEADLKFLENFPFGKDKELYIVGNKADLRPKEEFKEILGHIRDTLNARRMNWAGICAYSSSEKKAYAYVRENIYPFLKRRNTPVNLYEDYQSRIDKVFKSFFDFINQDCDQSRRMIQKLKLLELQAFEKGAIGLSDSTSDLEEGIRELMGEFRGSHSREERLRKFNILKNSFKQTFEKFCQDLGLLVKKRRFCGQCGKQVDPALKICPYCKNSL